MGGLHTHINSYIHTLLHTYIHTLILNTHRHTSIIMKIVEHGSYPLEFSTDLRSVENSITENRGEIHNLLQLIRKRELKIDRES